MKNTICCLIFLTLVGCINLNDLNTKYTNVVPFYRYRYLGFDMTTDIKIEMFKDTKVWDLAKAVYEQDTDKIKIIALKDTSLINYHKEGFEFSVLDWAIYYCYEHDWIFPKGNRYYSIHTLLELGANPNLRNVEGVTPMLKSCNFMKTSAYLLEMIKYGGNVNDIINTKDNITYTPLKESCGYLSNIENVKILIKSGADINLCDSEYCNVYHEAYLFDRIDVFKFLIMDYKVNLHKAIYIDDFWDSTYIYDLVYKLDFKQDSIQNEIKNEVMAYMIKHNAKIGKHIYHEEYFDIMDSFKFSNSDDGKDELRKRHKEKPPLKRETMDENQIKTQFPSSSQTRH